MKCPQICSKQRRRGTLLYDKLLDPIFLETTEDYVVVLFRHKAAAPHGGRKINLPEVGVYKVRDGKVIESWMFHQDTVAILEFLKEAQQEAP